MLNNLFIIQSFFLPITFREAIILSLDPTETKLQFSIPLRDEVKQKVFQMKPKQSDVVKTSCFSFFTVIIYSNIFFCIFYFYFLRLYICVPVWRIQEKRRKKRRRNEKEAAGISEGGISASGLPRSRCFTQHNLFSKKYIQPHLQATARFVSSCPTCAPLHNV